MHACMYVCMLMITDDNTPYTIENDMEDDIFQICQIRQKYFFNGLWITI